MEITQFPDFKISLIPRTLPNRSFPRKTGQRSNMKTKILKNKNKKIIAIPVIYLRLTFPRSSSVRTVSLAGFSRTINRADKVPIHWRSLAPPAPLPPVRTRRADDKNLESRIPVHNGRLTLAKCHDAPRVRGRGVQSGGSRAPGTSDVRWSRLISAITQRITFAATSAATASPPFSSSAGEARSSTRRYINGSYYRFAPGARPVPGSSPFRLTTSRAKKARFFFDLTDICSEVLPSVMSRFARQRGSQTSGMNSRPLRYYLTRHLFGLGWSNRGI